MTARAVPIEELHSADLAGFGHVVHLGRDAVDTVSSIGAGFTDRYTAEPLIEAPGHLGLTSVAALPAHVLRMERHLYTSEALFCAGEAVVVPVAPIGSAPRTSELRALLIRPGQALVLAPGVWHAPCLGLNGPASYYWHAAVDDSVETVWTELDEGPVRIANEEAAEHGA